MLKWERDWLEIALPLVWARSLELRKLHYRADLIRRDLKFLHRVGELPVRGVISEGEKALSEVNEKAWALREELQALCTGTLVRIYNDKDEAEWINLSYIYDRTMRTWRVALLQRLRDLKRKSRVEEVMILLLMNEVENY